MFPSDLLPLLLKQPAWWRGREREGGGGRRREGGRAS